jgi:magnesium transporter
MRALTSVDLAELRDLRARDEFFWLDLTDPERETMREVGEALSLHRLAVEDTQEFGQRPKADDYGDQLLLVYFGAGYDAGAPVPVEVHMHISGSFVLTVHRERCRQFEAVQEMAERRPAASEQALIYRVIDALTDSVLDVLDKVAGMIERYEAEIFHRPRARDRDRMALLRRSLAAFRRVLVIQRQVFDRAIERIVGLPGLEQDLTTYWRDVGDHLGAPSTRPRRRATPSRACSTPTRTRCRSA